MTMLVRVITVYQVVLTIVHIKDNKLVPSLTIEVHFLDAILGNATQVRSFRQTEVITMVLTIIVPLPRSEEVANDLFPIGIKGYVPIIALAEANR